MTDRSEVAATPWRAPAKLATLTWLISGSTIFQ